MSVTLDVFQLEMSASKFSKLKKSQLMSETAETSQSTMGPYVASAKATSALYAWTAVSREALVVKVHGCGGLDGGGDGDGDGDGGLGDGGGGLGDGGLGDGQELSVLGHVVRVEVVREVVTMSKRSVAHA